MTRSKILFLISYLLIISQAFADVRSDIDSKRVGYFDKKGLELSREFIKLDSNYYVGWMYEACVRYDRSQDKFGFELAQKSFEKSITKFENDFKLKLKVKPDDIMAFIDAYPRQVDYTFMAYHLFSCYMATEQIDKAYILAKKVLKYKMSNPIYFDPYNHLCWVTHRSRTQTSKQYNFLKDNVLANERLALKYLDSSDILINKNYAANAALFGESMMSDYYNYNTYYRSMIYSYLSKVDSAEYNFEKLKHTRHFSHNNYAYLKLVSGDFEGCEKEFLIEKQNDNPAEKRTKEFNYMLSIINIYKGNPRLDVDSLPNAIEQKGEIPGFGWDNLALARSCYYAAEHKKAQKYVKVADEFSELHLNTTWSPEQYKYSISLLKYLLSEREIQYVKFNNKGWWYNFSILKELPALYIDKINKSYIYTNDFALNKEREYAFYQLFNSECLISFDEIWKTIEQYNTSFFIKKYNEYSKLTHRKGVKRYYLYFLAKLYFKEKDYTKTLKYLDLVLNDSELQKNHEVLLLARINELKALVYKELENKSEEDKYALAFYELYPSLYQFSSLDKKFNLTVKNNSVELDSLVDELKNTQIEISETNSFVYPTIELTLLNKNKSKLVYYEVVSTGKVLFKDTLLLKKNAGILLAHRLYGSQIDDIELYDTNNLYVIGLFITAILLLWIIYYIRKRRHIL